MHTILYNIHQVERQFFKKIMKPVVFIENYFFEARQTDHF